MPNLLKTEKYNPVPLLDTVIQKLGLRSDSGLARYLGVGAPMICRVRQKKMVINPNLLIRMHDALRDRQIDLDLDDLRKLANIPKTKLTIPPKEREEDHE